jgi:hypothetical protein
MSSDAQDYCAALRRLVGDKDPLYILERTASRIQSLMSGIDDAVLRQRPRPNQWSIAEIIAHRADSELVFGYRLRMILGVNGTQLQAFDPDAWASTLAYDACDVHRTIRGHVSEAMLCDAGHADRILPALLEPEWPVPNGTRAG